jgi:hypothetical protein
MSRLLVFLGVFCAGTLAFSAPSNVEVIAGRIVAYSGALTCMNGNAYWSMIIHVQDRARDISSDFIQVQFSLPCDETPKWITHKPSLQKFRLTRLRDSDSMLEEFMDCANGSPGVQTGESCVKVRIWKHVPGTEKDKLPFGHRVPAYRSLDLPLTPVV